MRIQTSEVHVEELESRATIEVRAQYLGAPLGVVAIVAKHQIVAGGAQTFEAKLA